MSVAFEIAIVALLLAVNGFFAMSELAIVSARRVRLQAWVAEGRRGARLALALAEDPGKFLSSVQIGITLVGILAGAYSGATLAGELARVLAEMPRLAPFAEGLSIAVVVGGITYASLIVGELVPKQIALANPEAVASAVAGPMTVLAKLASPVVWILEVSSRLLMAALRIHRSADHAMTEEEVKAVIAEGVEAGAIEREEREMMSAVLRLGDRKVKAIMTPRHDLDWIDLTWNTDRVRHAIRNCPHSRLPVCDGDISNVIGVVQAKDIADRLLDGGPFELRPLVRELAVVHNNSPALNILELLRRSTIHMALVVDEYGSVEGIVTATDILSSIVGSLSEHGQDYEPGAVQREDGSWLMDGDLLVDMAAERLGFPGILPEGEDYTTLAGFVLANLRAIPTAGDHFFRDGWRFEVVDMDGRRIDKILAERLPEA
jgi:putative hemolysin